MDWTSDAAKLLLSQGLLGLAVLVLGAVTVVLWRALLREQDASDAKDAKLVETLTAWREDTKQTASAMASLLDKTVVIAEALRTASNRGTRR